VIWIIDFAFGLLELARICHECHQRAKNMSERLKLPFTIIAVLAASPALGEAAPRVRGVVVGVDDGKITVQQRGSGIVTLNTSRDTSYAYVVPSSLDTIRVNDYVGAAVKGAPDSVVAVEVALIPDNMREGRISFYEWDELPDPTASGTSKTTATSMTNGSVRKVAAADTARTDATVAKGTVSNEQRGASGLSLMVELADGSKTFQMTVPPNAPVVRYVLTDRSALSKGDQVFIKVNPGDLADLVTIGKGVTPPM
jgi:hypothetical protein